LIAQDAPRGPFAGAVRAAMQVFAPVAPFLARGRDPFTIDDE